MDLKDLGLWCCTTQLEGVYCNRSVFEEISKEVAEHGEPGCGAKGKSNIEKQN